MSTLGGRDDDFVYLPSGRKVSPRLVATVVRRALDDFCGRRGVGSPLRAFQVVQDVLDHLTIRHRFRPRSPGRVRGDHCFRAREAPPGAAVHGRACRRPASRAVGQVQEGHPSHGPGRPRCAQAFSSSAIAEM